MPKIARVVLPDCACHVTQKGVRYGDVFLTPEDRAEYWRLLREQCHRHGVRILSYCLMTNHVHLVAVPEKAGDLARGIGEVHKRYTRYVGNSGDTNFY